MLKRKYLNSASVYMCVYRGKDFNSVCVKGCMYAGEFTRAGNLIDGHVNKRKQALVLTPLLVSAKQCATIVCLAMCVVC